MTQADSPSIESSPSISSGWSWQLVLRRIGPSLITACVVIGPGSILTSSTVGANQGYSMLWVVVVSVFFMMLFMTLGAKLGAVASASPCELIRQKVGRPLAYLVGGGIFFIAAAFQAGNNIAVTATIETYVSSQILVVLLLVLFNLVAISFLYLFRNVYQMLERIMTAFVATMLVSFAINLFRLKPDPVAMVQGLVPSTATVDVAVLGLIGTTFVVAAAFYQAYLVRQKGWSINELSRGIVDARIGSLIILAITIMLMSTAAAGLYTGEPVKFSDPVAVAEALRPTFGSTGKLIFCFGLFSAAYSSFLVNSMIGGFVLSDALRLGTSPTDPWPRALTTLILLMGMVVSIATMLWGFDRTPTIIAAQAVTMVVAPLIAAVLLWLTSSTSVMGTHVNGPLTKLAGMIGLGILLAIAANTAIVKLPQSLEQYRSPAAPVVEPVTK